ncbi:MAG: hypothetical protein V4671_12810 [Armatimonadota bacterium]
MKEENSTNSERASLAQLVRRVRRRTGLGVLMCKEALERVPPEHRERYILWHETNHQQLFHDPIETDPEFASIMEVVDKEVAEQVEAMVREWETEGNTGIRLGPTRYSYWHFKRRLLKERCGIDWKSPAELTRILIE